MGELGVWHGDGLGGQRGGYRVGGQRGGHKGGGHRGGCRSGNRGGQRGRGNWKGGKNHSGAGNDSGPHNFNQHAYGNLAIHDGSGAPDFSPRNFRGSGAAPQMKYSIGFKEYVLELKVDLLLYYTAYDATLNTFQTSKASRIGTSRRQQCPDVLLQTGVRDNDE